MTPLKQLLITARALIADEDDWTTGALARNGYGELVSYTDPDVCLLCGMGAVKRAANTMKLDHKTTLPAFKALEEVNNLPITYVNDNLGHAEVLRTFDEAIRTTK